jgi:hypothetical protein
MIIESESAGGIRFCVDGESYRMRLLRAGRPHVRWSIFRAFGELTVLLPPPVLETGVALTRDHL